jgi:hypothetical protein
VLYFRIILVLARSQNCEKQLLVSSCLFVLMEQLGSHWGDFQEIWHLKNFSKFCRDNSSVIKIGQECRVLYMKTYVHFLIISRSFLLRMRNVSDKSCRETQNTLFVFSNLFFENRAVYEKMWKNYAETGRSQMTIWRMRIACWISEATNSHTVV